MKNLINRPVTPSEEREFRITQVETFEKYTRHGLVHIFNRRPMISSDVIGKIHGISHEEVIEKVSNVGVWNIYDMFYIKELTEREYRDCFPAHTKVALAFDEYRGCAAIPYPKKIISPELKLALSEMNSMDSQVWHAMINEHYNDFLRSHKVWRNSVTGVEPRFMDPNDYLLGILGDDNINHDNRKMVEAFGYYYDELVEDYDIDDYSDDE